MKGTPKAIFDVLRDVQNFKERLIRFTHSIRGKREVLTKVLCKNHGIDASPPSEPLLPHVLSETAPLKMVFALKGLREVAETNLQILKKGVYARLDQMMSACFPMDLSPLFSSEVGRVIHSFIPTDAETLGKAVESFAESGETQTVRDDLLLLLKVGADIDGLHEGKNALTRAVYAGSLQAVEILVEAGVEPNMKGGEEKYKDYIALYRTCYERRADIIRFLVSQGANVNAKDDSERSPLACAVFKGLREIFEFLLEKGADLKTKNFCGYSNLYNAALGNQREMAEMLINKGLEVDVRDDHQTTPLHLTVDATRDGGVKDNVEVAELLLDHGADPNALQDDGCTIALDAAAFWCVKVLKLVINHSADLQATSNDGRNSLHWAATWLLDENSDRLSESQLFHENKREIAEFLVAKGIDASAEEHNGNTAAELATRSRFPVDLPLIVFLSVLQDEETGDGDKNDNDED
uniref:Uncharacterized protein n=1 Tax=Chromera velia CCMP2878 TaxID=1169474 RepID=A0A0G4HVZ3_9ALVE|eukprot:Cvel_8962.t1-p1 / transcript=Cvel_8962.t1 / gene=Cvel_8962 / organism=Chromera_velia_CCMP2878 / gene_product=Putative ankyrin repeat protein MM_0045, putative / transcript_product=Putative ankyrin repeat protein MM_0045, putative / location=Cvel_scaffold505:45027-46421(-) / protein_length=465 / sequence_SO=supercontig / SO=protein_coding / is_pseudo=false